MRDTEKQSINQPTLKNVGGLSHAELQMDKEKRQVYEFWNEFSCGEQLYLHGIDEKEKYINQSIIRYQLEPYIPSFADFAAGRGKRVLEIGVGLGADHQRWAESGCDLFGIDLTDRSITNTSRRFRIFGLTSKLTKADAENLPFNSESFDIVYPYSDTFRKYVPNTRIYGYIKERFPSALATAKPRFYVGKFGQCTKVSL